MNTAETILIPPKDALGTAARGADARGADARESPNADSKDHHDHSDTAGSNGPNMLMIVVYACVAILVVILIIVICMKTFNTQHKDAIIYAKESQASAEKYKEQFERSNEQLRKLADRYELLSNAYQDTKDELKKFIPMRKDSFEIDVPIEIDVPNDDSQDPESKQSRPKQMTEKDRARRIVSTYRPSQKDIDDCQSGITEQVLAQQDSAIRQTLNDITKSGTYVDEEQDDVTTINEEPIENVRVNHKRGNR